MIQEIFAVPLSRIMKLEWWNCRGPKKQGSLKWISESVGKKWFLIRKNMRISLSSLKKIISFPFK